MRGDLDATHLHGLVQTGPSDSLRRCVWNVDDTQYAHIDQPFRITDGTDPDVAAQRLEDHFRGLGYTGDGDVTVWTYAQSAGVVGVRLEATRCSFLGDQ